MLKFIRSLFLGIGRLFRTVFGLRKPFAEFRKEGGVVAFRLLQERRVRRDLGLSGQQVRQIVKFTNVARQRRSKEFQALQNREGKKGPAFVQLQRQVAAEVLAALKKEGVLAPEQKERLRQLVWQQQGAMAFGNPLVRDALKLTPEQQEGMRDILDEMNEQRRQRRESSEEDKEEGGKQGGTLRQQALDRILALLDDEQKARWEQLKGKPLEVDLSGPAAAGPDTKEQNPVE
jgi:hypothetical protein